jgi:VanZ family protein
MIRYYKFLIVNVLVFFCVGTAAMQSVLQSFRSPTRSDILEVVADSFPAGGPFYVGWRKSVFPTLYGLLTDTIQSFSRRPSTRDLNWR